jgi:hypothetical protein
MQKSSKEKTRMEKINKFIENILIGFLHAENN